MEKQSFEELMEDLEIIELKRGKIFEGKVLEIDNDGLWVALEGCPGDVFVTQDELSKSKETYKIEDLITVKILKVNDAEGLHLASEKKAMWEKIFNEIKEGENYKAIFKERVKNGYTVLIEGTVKAFLPGSLSLLRVYDEMPSEEVGVKVIAKNGKNIIVSRKDYVEEKLDDFFNIYKMGMLVEGIIEDVKDFGAFVRLSEYVTAFLPRNEVSWNNKVDLKEFLKKGKKIKAIITNIDQENKKINLSMKLLKNDPWETVEEKYPVGSIVKGVVTKIFPFGFTVEIEEGVEGLVHESQIFWGRRGRIENVVKVGDIVSVKVLEIDKNKRKMNLSYKLALGDPWENIEEKYSEGTIVEGVVEKILENGAIIKVKEGLTGFLHVSELSWNFIDNVNNYLKEGNTVMVKILSIDKDNRKMRLSVRKSTENPWKKVIKEIKPGDIVKGKITRFVDRGAIVLVDDHNVEAYLPSSKASFDSKNVRDIFEIGEEVKVKVLEVNLENENKRGNMVVSIINLNNFEGKEAEEILRDLE
ncbi:MAG TPA: S1 RNA-binding domain-containing protein [Defluviitoga sp.]|nr:S1 RNA-binding domain-containing protein [Defluviitoga sp.]HOP24276.1 S1 RNA-binding domain-containing protein [Defluviitoga sp.]HPZ28132.1 S1 RNA-binding domain-containing protein [Defluviitoga sp.]HQD62022.1 S1 RNA-binding domain-containing protein [Defluviitoga sp.]